MPPCRAACPARTDVRRYLSLAVEGRYAEGFAVAYEPNPFAASCGRICNHPCESACRRASVDEPLAISRLKRFLFDAAFADADVGPAGSTASLTGVVAHTGSAGKRIAVVGAGPAGLAAAADLARAGCDVSVHEAANEGGGALRWGVPAYRLPRAVLAREIAWITNLGVRLALEAPVSDMSALTEASDAVLVAVGASQPVPLGIRGEELEGVMPALGFLRSVARGETPALGRHAVVVGGVTSDGPAVV